MIEEIYSWVTHVILVQIVPGNKQAECTVEAGSIWGDGVGDELAPFF